MSVLNHTSWEMFHTHNVVAHHSGETAQKLKADMHYAYHDTIVRRTGERKCRRGGLVLPRANALITYLGAPYMYIPRLA